MPQALVGDIGAKAHVELLQVTRQVTECHVSDVLAVAELQVGKASWQASHSSICQLGASMQVQALES